MELRIRRMDEARAPTLSRNLRFVGERFGLRWQAQAQRGSSSQSASKMSWRHSINPGKRFLRKALLLAFWLGVQQTEAVIFYSTADPEHNTTPPTNELASSGWEYQGLWGNVLGTAIAPKYFLTARHVGGAVGGHFILHGVLYPTTAFFDDPASDLRIWRVRGTFPSFALLYPRNDEVGQNIVVFGRGRRRGAEITVDGSSGLAFKGWHWGTPDGRLRWGENQIGGIANATVSARSGGTVSRDLLRVPFDADAGPNEAHLSDGDSAGAVFIQDRATWKLAGINFAIDGPYNTTDTGPGFYAAIFDEGGLYTGGEGNWTQAPDLPSDRPSAFYATRISSRLSWINNILSQPIPNDPPLLQSAPHILGPYIDELGAGVNEQDRVITFPPPDTLRFFRLSAAMALRITGSAIKDGKLILSYE